MAKKTQIAYEAVFDLMTTVATDLKPDVVITDFEIGLMNGAFFSFMNRIAQGCWFHYVYVSEIHFNNLC